jgi:hypothetical protein
MPAAFYLARKRRLLFGLKPSRRYWHTVNFIEPTMCCIVLRDTLRVQLVVGVRESFYHFDFIRNLKMGKMNEPIIKKRLFLFFSRFD